MEQLLTSIFLVKHLLTSVFLVKHLVIYFYIPRENTWLASPLIYRSRTVVSVDWPAVYCAVLASARATAPCQSPRRVPSQFLVKSVGSFYVIIVSTDRSCVLLYFAFTILSFLWLIITSCFSCTWFSMFVTSFPLNAAADLRCLAAAFLGVQPPRPAASVAPHQ